jgi:hypothetical protein
MMSLLDFLNVPVGLDAEALERREHGAEIATNELSVAARNSYVQGE